MQQEFCKLCPVDRKRPALPGTRLCREHAEAEYQSMQELVHLEEAKGTQPPENMFLYVRTLDRALQPPSPLTAVPLLLN